MEVIISSRDNLSENFFFVDLFGAMFTFLLADGAPKVLDGMVWAVAGSPPLGELN